MMLESCNKFHSHASFFRYLQYDASSPSSKRKLTPFTLALLEDSGWYKVDYQMAEAVSFGLNAGCGFVEDECIGNKDTDASSMHFFCDGPGFYNRCAPTSRNKAYTRMGASPLCAPAMCDKKKRRVEFEVDGIKHVCHEDFDEIEVKGSSSVVFQCPQIDAFCPEFGCQAACEGKKVCDWSKHTPKCK